MWFLRDQKRFAFISARNHGPPQPSLYEQCPLKFRLWKNNYTYCFSEKAIILYFSDQRYDGGRQISSSIPFVNEGWSFPFCLLQTVLYFWILQFCWGARLRVIFSPGHRSKALKSILLYLGESKVWFSGINICPSLSWFFYSFTFTAEGFSLILCGPSIIYIIAIYLKSRTLVWEEMISSPVFSLLVLPCHPQCHFPACPFNLRYFGVLQFSVPVSFYIYKLFIILIHHRL